jgi:ankyrin repeat protein
MDLHEACQENSLRNVKKIIKKQRKFSRRNRRIINKKNSRNQTPLSIATSQGHIEIVKYLLENGADPNIKGSIGTPIEIARSAMFHDIHDLLTQ